MACAPHLHLVYAIVGEADRRHVVLTHQVRPRSCRSETARRFVASRLPRAAFVGPACQAVDGDGADADELLLPAEDSDDDLADADVPAPESASSNGTAANAKPPTPEDDVIPIQATANSAPPSRKPEPVATPDIGALTLLPPVVDAATVALHVRRLAEAQARRKEQIAAFFHACERNAATSDVEVRPQLHAPGVAVMRPRRSWSAGPCVKTERGIRVGEM